MRSRGLLFSSAIVAFTLFCSCTDEAQSVTGSDPNPEDAGGLDASQPDAGDPSLGCGDGARSALETCDDGNRESGDGCDSKCAPEPGYTCPSKGGRCRATRCGDGLIAGAEECEDENVASGDGCYACRFEPGYACEPGAGCYLTVCNDGKREGDEPCDDGNTIIGDGCSPFCRVEPRCAKGACTSACGDGLRLGSEACDDGNTKAGDGCSPTCQQEVTYICKDVASDLPPSFELPAIFRDFIRDDANGSEKHPDFDTFSGSEAAPGLVSESLSASGKPIYTGYCQQGKMPQCPYNAQTTTKANFDQWYSDETTKFAANEFSPPVEGIRTTKNSSVVGTMIKVVGAIKMIRIADQTGYRNETFGRDFFPLDGKGWVRAKLEDSYFDHNFGFTSEVRHWFEFQGNETLTFSGDDDVWVFINGKLALDLGGLHGRVSRTVVLDTTTGDAVCFTNPEATNPCGAAPLRLGLVKGQVYEMALFHAERHVPASNFDLTLTGFTAGRSQCESSCGNGVFQPEQGEQCDDGNREDDDQCDRDCQSQVLL